MKRIVTQQAFNFIPRDLQKYFKFTYYVSKTSHKPRDVMIYYETKLNIIGTFF